MNTSSCKSFGLVTHQAITCSKSTIETLEKYVEYFQRLNIRHQTTLLTLFWSQRRSDVLIVNFEQISHFFELFQLLTLNR